MQIELITNVAKSSRFAPNWVDRAWLICENAGSGNDGLSTARQGDAACLYIVGATTYTDRNGVTASVGYEAIECHATNAPPVLLLGAWHDTPDVGYRGRIQCHGWDDDVLVNVTTAAAAPGLPVNAAAGQPYVDDVAAPAADGPTHGYLGTVVERSGNMADATADNHAVFWRAC